VVIQAVETADIAAIQALLRHYIAALEETDQQALADHIRVLCVEGVIAARFVKVLPAAPFLAAKG
jgi:hypothetical protein